VEDGAAIENGGWFLVTCAMHAKQNGTSAKKIPLRLLTLFCPRHLYEEIEGDLLEKFDRDEKAFGFRMAKRRLWWNVVRFIRPGILFRNKVTLNSYKMINHHFVTYWRNVSKHKMSSVLNLLGLVVGLSGAWLMTLFVGVELAVDDFPHASSTYRIVFGETDESGSVPTAHVLGSTIASNYPGVKVIRFTNAGNAQVNFKYGETKFMETSFYFTDPEALSVFPFNLVDGDPATCLIDPFTMVITRRAAIRYFGEESAVGKIISVDWAGTSYDLMVTGLMDESQNNSHLQFDFLISMATAERIFRPESYFTDWTANFSVDYLHVENPETAALINSEVTALYRRNTPQLNANPKLRLQPVKRIHLHSHLGRELGKNSDVRYVYVAGVIGLLILLVTLINYTNLMYALYTRRLKEVGIRKSLGADHSSIVKQFLGESMTNVLIAIFLVILIGVVTSPMLRPLLGDTWRISQLAGAQGVGTLLVLLTAGVIAGLYPSLLLAGRSAGDILYGKVSMSWRGSWMKNGLVAFQLFIALFILIGALITQRQLNFMLQKDMGYEKDFIITIPHGRAVRERSETVKRELMQTGGVVSATLSSTIPSRSLGFKVPAKVEGARDGAEPWPVALVSVDFDFFETFGLQLSRGRTFSPSFAGDSTEGFVINETAAKSLQWDEPIGKEIQMTYNVGNGTVETRKGRVIGVIRDFNFESLHKPIEPVVFMFKPFWFYFVTVKLKAGDQQEALSALKTKWEYLAPDIPFEYGFMTDRLSALYRTEQTWVTATSIFSMVAVGISSLGLLGLVSFLVQTKLKEIAVRKVMGADSRTVFARLYGTVLLLIGIAGIPAMAFAWMAGRAWMSNFAFQAPLGGDLFVSALLMVIGVSTIAIAGQLVRAAMVNPITVLRSE